MKSVTRPVVTTVLAMVFLLSMAGCAALEEIAEELAQPPSTSSSGQSAFTSSEAGAGDDSGCPHDSYAQFSLRIVEAYSNYENGNDRTRQNYRRLVPQVAERCPTFSQKFRDEGPVGGVVREGLSGSDIPFLDQLPDSVLEDLLVEDDETRQAMRESQRWFTRLTR